MHPDLGWADTSLPGLYAPPNYQRSDGTNRLILYHISLDAMRMLRCDAKSRGTSG
jgi:hypothetical protein